MSDIALVLCPGSPRDDWKNTLPPGIHYVKNMLTQEGLGVTVINPQNLSNYPREAYIQDIQDSGARAIGISASGSSYKDLKRFSKFLKKETDLPIGVGGFISILGEEVLDTMPSIDAMLEGEGELRSGDFFRALIDGKDFSDIEGIFYREGKSILYTGKAAPISQKTLDQYVPEFTNLDKSLKPRKTAYLYSSRGCYNRCTYCSIGDLHGENVRSISPQKLNETIELLATKYGVTQISFNDDEFLFKPGRLSEIADTLEKYRVGIRFQTRAKDILISRNQTDLLRLHKSGLLERVSVGVESFYDPALERWKKNTTAEENMKALEFLDTAKIRNYPYLMLIDKDTTAVEALNNLDSLITLNESHMLFGLMFRYLDKKQTLGLVNPINDSRGLNHLHKEQERFVGLMRESKRQLSLYNDVISASRHKDNHHVNLLFDATNAMYLSAIASLLTGMDGAEAARDHKALRRRLKAVSRISNAKNARQRRKKKMLEREIKQQFGDWSYLFRDIISL